MRTPETADAPIPSNGNGNYLEDTNLLRIFQKQTINIVPTDRQYILITISMISSTVKIKRRPVFIPYKKA